MKQVRNTTAKSHIQELLIQQKNAMSQQDIQTLSEGVCDRVTIYRVLDRLLEEGVIHRTIGIDGVARFAPCSKCDANHSHHHNHVHFNCEKCQEVTCLENVVPDFKLPRNYTMKEVNFTVSGVCAKCN